MYKILIIIVLGAFACGVVSGHNEIQKWRVAYAVAR